MMDEDRVREKVIVAYDLLNRLHQILADADAYRSTNLGQFSKFGRRLD